MASAAATTRVHEGKVALVTGSARGIGTSIARNLAGKGANVLIIYVSEPSDVAAKELASELEQAHSIKAIPCRADITTPEGCELIISTCKSNFSKNDRLQIDILVHNAALFHSLPLEAVTIEDFHKVYATNVLGPILLTQACKPYLPTDRSGRIVNVSSIGSKVGLQHLTLYGGSKGALEAMTRTWARELAESCTVNCINPSSVMTDMFEHASPEVKGAIGLFNALTPLAGIRDWDSDKQKEFNAQYGGRIAYPEEIANMVGMICSPEASWMTGCLVSANGGQWMSG